MTTCRVERFGEQHRGLLREGGVLVVEHPHKNGLKDAGEAAAAGVYSAGCIRP